jgi:hypothetical protein
VTPEEKEAMGEFNKWFESVSPVHFSLKSDMEEAFRAGRQALRAKLWQREVEAYESVIKLAEVIAEGQSAENRAAEVIAYLRKVVAQETNPLGVVSEIEKSR